MRPVRRETRPANVKGHWLLRRCTSTGRGVYSQILFVWSAQNHSGYMGGESTNDQDECSQMYFQLIYQGLNFSLGNSITIWYLIRDVWLQSSDHFKLRLLFKPIFNHTFNPIFKSVSVLIMSMYVLLYYVPVYIPNITKIKPKAKNTCQMLGHQESQDETDAESWVRRGETGASPLNIDRATVSGLATVKSESCPMLTELR